MNKPGIINKKIVDIYKIWFNEIQQTSPHLLSEDFSNIFCTGVGDDWFNSDMRILIVGEEATWGSRSNHQYADYYVELKECQKWIIKYLNSQLNIEKHPHAFWQRIQDIHSVFPEAQICWTNIDVINTKAGKALKQKDRKALHSCKTRLLHEVIKTTNPTHIIFFGWHNTSLEHELPELLNTAYPKGIADNSFIKSQNYIFNTKFDGKNVILSYHPNYVPIRYNKNYINKLIKLIKQEN